MNESQKNMENAIRKIFPDVIPQTSTWHKLSLLYIECGVNALAELETSFAESDKKGVSQNDIHSSASEV